MHPTKNNHKWKRLESGTFSSILKFEWNGVDESCIHSCKIEKVDQEHTLVVIMWSFMKTRVSQYKGNNDVDPSLSSKIYPVK